MQVTKHFERFKDSIPFLTKVSLCEVRHKMFTITELNKLLKRLNLYSTLVPVVLEFVFRICYDLYDIIISELFYFIMP